MTKHDDFASRLIERRAQLGWSQEQLSRESGVAAAQISRYEARINKPRANVIAKLAKGLLVPFAWLANGDTSEFRIDDAPRGFIDLMLNIPRDVVEAISRAAAASGISEDEYMIRALEESIKKDLMSDKKPT
ncbi:TPA: helix-turn-helix domain-containing protein [Klebsiella pneumoniae]|uniref:helix-turn-helix domain-containing protein n=1 Tax=Klebsiella pneumoniae TaxID=573 RepID=UPI0009082DB7|nr:helix-turn-helix transcriptional regulator [Klebsiella pneumoniae]HBQ1879798.1 helix-turn-helix domain-containing protein [Klebsiella pneumoniae]HBT5790280.1 helix-turn-helix domain-containing protein [Klebsiella pneumoniae]